MKRVVLAVFMLMGMLGASFGSTAEPVKAAVSDAQCKYKLADARAGLKVLVPVGFAPREQSADGNRQVGVMFFHNPASKDSQSVDAMTLIMVDKRAPEKELTLLVVYIGPKQSVVFKREIKQGKAGQALGPCFERTLEDNSKQ